MTERPGHFVDSRQLSSPTWLGELFDQTDKMAAVAQGHEVMRKRDVMAYLSFHQPSDITISSFLRALGHLGWGFYAREIPGQSLWINNLEHEVTVAGALGYDVVVLRGSEIGEVEKAAESSEIPVISAGEGFKGNRVINFGQHPTQATADIYTINKIHGHLDGLRIVMPGDKRHNPVINSLLCALSQFRVDLVLLGNPPMNSIPEDVEEYLLRNGIARLSRADDVGELERADVVYIAHPQNGKGLPQSYQPSLTTQDLDRLPNSAVVMHDMIAGFLPQIGPEIPRGKGVYTLQLRNGVYNRMAVLSMLV